MWHPKEPAAALWGAKERCSREGEKNEEHSKDDFGGILQPHGSFIKRRTSSMGLRRAGKTTTLPGLNH